MLRVTAEPLDLAVNLIGLARDERPDHASLLEPLLAEPSCADRALDFAPRHAEHDPAAAIADRCESLLSQEPNRRSPRQMTPQARSA